MFPDDSARFSALSGRIGGVVNLGGGLDIAAKYTRGFRAPNTTDLGIIGLVGAGFEVDARTAAARGGFIGTTSGGDAVSTGIPVTRLGPEYSDSFDLSFRYSSRRFGAELTGFTTKLTTSISIKLSYCLPARPEIFSAADQIISQNPAGLVFVAQAPTSPVLVRVNFDDARFNGVEFDSRARFSEQLSGTANFTYIRAHSLLNGLPPKHRRRHSTSDSFRKPALSTSFALLPRSVFDGDRTAESFVLARFVGPQNWGSTFAS